MFDTAAHSKLACFLCAIFLWNFATPDGSRPYEFSFNIVDFQHRYEKKDANGIITGEYGFITADGVYRETGYATDSNGDFIITRMTYRRIKSLKDAREIFKDRPEAAKNLLEAVARACGSCKIAAISDNPDGTERSASTVTSPASRANPAPVSRRIVGTLPENRDVSSQGRNRIPQDRKDTSNERRGKSLPEGIARGTTNSAKELERKGEPVYSKDRGAKINDRTPENAPNDLRYRFNYTITSHEHQEDGYRSGKKDGSYRAQSENGVDTRVKYLSNEFGHQPNVSFVPSANAANESQRLKGYSFLWFRS